jgi:hypothetical protein
MGRSMRGIRRSKERTRGARAAEELQSAAVHRIKLFEVDDHARVLKGFARKSSVFCGNFEVGRVSGARYLAEDGMGL